MSYRQKSLEGAYLGDCVGEYDREMLGVSTIAHMNAAAYGFQVSHILVGALTVFSDSRGSEGLYDVMFHPRLQHLGIYCASCWARYSGSLLYGSLGK